MEMPKDGVRVTKGLRQEGALFPFLFTIVGLVVDILSKMMLRA